MNALEKYAAKRNLITKLSVAIGSIGSGIRAVASNQNSGATSRRTQAIRRGAPSYSTGNSTMPIKQTPDAIKGSPVTRPARTQAPKLQLRQPSGGSFLASKQPRWKQPTPGNFQP